MNRHVVVNSESAFYSRFGFNDWRDGCVGVKRGITNRPVASETEANRKREKTGGKQPQTKLNKNYASVHCQPVVAIIFSIPSAIPQS